MSEPTPTRDFRILSLDGGGAKGVYTLGILRELEGALGAPLSSKFDLIFGTSTGSIIASLLALGRTVPDIYDLYREHVAGVMKRKSPAAKSEALRLLAVEVFGAASFGDFQTGIGIVATNWATERPMIFKANPAQAHGRKGTFVPGFGCAVADAVQASCSAFPFFEKKIVQTSDGPVELVDGGYCANNPTLYAIADATESLGVSRTELRVLSLGVGLYPLPTPALLSKMWLAQHLLSVQLLQKTFEINTQSMEQLRSVLFGDVASVRIDDAFTHPEMATDLFEHDPAKLSLLHQQGRQSFGKRESDIRQLLE